MPTDANSYAQLLQAFSMPGAGIDIPQFEQTYLPPPPPAPPVITQGDPFNRALATVGAGLAQPIQPNQTVLGNTANAALSGLQYLDQARAANNQAAQQTFENELEIGKQQQQQGQTVVNAEQANAQRGYYSGLLKSAGMDALASAADAGDERTLEWAKIATDLTEKMIEVMDPETLLAMDPAGGPGIFQDIMDMLVQNQDLSTITANLTAKRQAFQEQQETAQKQQRWAAFAIKYPELASTQAEYEADPNKWLEKYAAEVKRLNQERAQKATESTPIADTVLDLIQGESQITNPNNPRPPLSQENPRPVSEILNDFYKALTQ